MMKFIYAAFAGFILVAITGCSFNPPDDLGTQTGYVTEVLPVGAEPKEETSCRIAMTPDERSTGRYVEVQFRTYRMIRSTYAFTPVSMSLEKGDKVIVKHPYCVGSHQPQIIGFSAK